jgi:hypothetical protein
MSCGVDSQVFSASGRVGMPAARNDYFGYIVTVTTATGAINIREAMNASGDEITNGPIIDVIPAGTAAGGGGVLTEGINANRGIYVEFNGGATGTVRVLYR